MCGCPGNTNHVEINPCEAVTVEILQMIKKPLDCYIENGFFDRGISEVELRTAQSNVIAWIESKVIDPASCEHQEKLAGLQELMQKIYQNGYCY